MKKLTDEQVAKALGKWKPDSYKFSCPRYTSSLDAIVGEIEARGLDWSIAVDSDHLDVTATVGTPIHNSSAVHFDIPAAEALCVALLAYLKDRP